MPTLVLPSAAHRASYLEACAEIRVADRPAWKETRIDASNVDAHIAALVDARTGRNLPDGWVPSTELWLVEDDRWLGRVDIRHRLTPSLEKYGGHIGYIVRPSERGHGYAHLLLEGALAFARDTLGLERVLVTCREDNAASARVIEKHGGVYQGSVPRPDGDGMTRLYWIALG